mgnify:CR=1 FL=1
MIKESPTPQACTCSYGSAGVCIMRCAISYWYAWSLVDTAFVLRNSPDFYFLSKEKFVDMVRTHGTDHILFGTDSPWSDQSEALKLIRESGLNNDEIRMLLAIMPPDYLIHSFYVKRF